MTEYSAVPLPMQHAAEQATPADQNGGQSGAGGLPGAGQGGDIKNYLFKRVLSRALQPFIQTKKRAITEKFAQSNHKTR